MGKRIRHLEFYGYADQNVYIGLPNADLSDIRETNKEQDKEINAISGATKEKADLELVKELSGKVDTFIDSQSAINENLASGITINSEKINALQQRDEEITSKLNEIVDAFNPINEKLDALDNKVDELDAKVDEYASFKDEATNKFNEIDAELAKKLDKTEAEETYAKKSDVYTKNQVNNLLEDYSSSAASKTWVINQGYLTRAEADSRYASKESVNALSDRVNSGQTTIINQYNTLNSNFTSFKTLTNSRLEVLSGRVTTLEEKHDREISSISGKVDDLQSQINANKDEIRRIKEVDLPNKVDKSEFNDLKNDVNQLEVNLNNKVDKVDYNIDKTNITNALNDLDSNKADKSALTQVNDSIASLRNDLTNETNQRIDADNDLLSRIQATNIRIDGIESGNTQRDETISDLSDRLEAEIVNRINGDKDIIGQPSDIDSKLTIYGTRKYADKVASNAVNEANNYTDEKDSALRIYINDEVLEPLQMAISSKADVSYVNNVKEDILNQIDAKIDVETQRAKGEELRIETNLAQETNRALEQERALISATTHIGNIVAAMTDWDGDDRISYTDEGNGIIDVMHRELHDVKESIANVSEGIQTNNDKEASFGTYNVSRTGSSDSEKTAFSIGIGTSDANRKNAFEIMKNGDIYMWINGEFKCINRIIENLLQE